MSDRYTHVVKLESGGLVIEGSAANDRDRRRDAAAPKTDWDALRRMTDDEVERRAGADPDAQPTDEEFWADAKLVMPKTKTPVSIRVDDDVLFWFKSFGKGYQTKMNAVLRAYMDSVRKSQK